MNKNFTLTGAAKYVPRNRAARKTAKYKNFWVVMRQARNIDGCFFIRRYSKNEYDYIVITNNNV